MKYLLFPDMSGYATEKAAKAAGSILHVEFDGISRGTLFISNAVIPITDGAADIPTRHIPQGTSPVTVFKDRSRESFDCGKITRKGNDMLAENEDMERDFIYLKRQVYANAAEQRRLETRISQLEEKINGYKIF